MNSMSGTGMMRGLLSCAGALFVLALLSSAYAADTIEPATEKKQTWFILPTVSYDTDNGLSFGGVAGAQLQFQPSPAPTHRLFVQGRASLSGYHSHQLKYVYSDFGVERRFSLSLAGEYRRWKKAEYFGIGNSLVRSYQPNPFQPGSHSFESYGHSRPTFKSQIEVKVRDQLRGYAGFGTTYNEIQIYPGTLLEQQAPLGIHGGLTVELFGGLLWDTRTAPDTDGIILEAGMRNTLPLPTTVRNGQYAGLHLGLQGFWLAHPSIRLVLRAMGDWLLGSPSFDAMNEWGGYQGASGFGGGESIRGPLYGRWRGPGKWVCNAEARFHIGETVLLDTHTAFGLVTFLDVGMVFDTPDQGQHDYLFAPIHPGLGVGGRLTFDDAFILRIDFGIGVDPREDAAGTVVNDPSYGFYILAGELF